MPGYKVFLQDGGGIREGLTCSYCKLVLKDPVQTSESGQRFCWECYEVLKASRNLKQGVWRDHAVEIEITKLLVKCPYHIAGCSWHGRFKNSAEHETACEYQDVITSEPYETNVTADLLSEQFKMVAGVQQLSTPIIEDVRSLTHSGGQHLQYPPMDLSNFQGWVTTLFDQVFEKIASINDQIIQLQESNASTYGGH